MLLYEMTKTVGVSGKNNFKVHCSLDFRDSNHCTLYGIGHPVFLLYT